MGISIVFLKSFNLDYSNIMLTLVPSIGILFEESSRVVEYTIFTYPRVIEGIWDLLIKLNFVKSLPFGRELIFAFSIAIFLILVKNKKDEVPSSYKSIFYLIFGKNSLN